MRAVLMAEYLVVLKVWRMAQRTEWMLVFYSVVRLVVEWAVYSAGERAVQLADELVVQ